MLSYGAHTLSQLLPPACWGGALCVRAPGKPGSGLVRGWPGGAPGFCPCGCTWACLALVLNPSKRKINLASSPYRDPALHTNHYFLATPVLKAKLKHIEC